MPLILTGPPHNDPLSTPQRSPQEHGTGLDIDARVRLGACHVTVLEQAEVKRAVGGVGRLRAKRALAQAVPCAGCKHFLFDGAHGGGGGGGGGTRTFANAVAGYQASSADPRDDELNFPTKSLLLQSAYRLALQPAAWVREHSEQLLTRVQGGTEMVFAEGDLARDLAGSPVHGSPRSAASGYEDEAL